VEDRRRPLDVGLSEGREVGYGLVVGAEVGAHLLEEREHLLGSRQKAQCARLDLGLQLLVKVIEAALQAEAPAPATLGGVAEARRVAGE
jgi:hypothetical protein